MSQSSLGSGSIQVSCVAISENIAEILRRKVRNRRAVPRIQRQPPRTPSALPVPFDRPDNAVPILDESVEGIKNKLGSINTCFPENETPAFEELTEFPDSYRQLSSKEKLTLLFAENFRRQYRERFSHRKPLILALPNECAVQKFVCSTLKPSIFMFPDLIGCWQSIASFVADYVIYEPLPDQINLPLRLLSPDTVLKRRKANSFELATLLCSYLIGNGFAACVVSGYATREIVNNDLRRVACPYVPDRQDQENTSQEVVEPCKYQLKEIPDLRSRYLMDIEEEKLAKIQEEEDKIEAARVQQLLDIERLPEDKKLGHRIHAWVVIIENAPWCYKAGFLETTIDQTTGEKVLKPPRAFFVEPATGFRYEVDSPCYLGIESVWNQHNYYVNKQEPISDIKNLRWDFRDARDWEHFIPGEPFELREETMPDDQEPLVTEEELEKEKHLDLPTSWVGPLSISMSDYEERFPGGSKVMYFKRTIYERFAPYSNMVGLITRLTAFETLEYERPLIRWEWYANREDLLKLIVHDYRSQEVEEVFAKGRADSLQSLKRSANGEKGCRLLFFHQYRFDALKELIYHPSYVIEHYDKRDDLLYYREFKNIPKVLETSEDAKLTHITEKFHRNAAKRAVKDIATRTCSLQRNRIFLKFHYGDDCITASTREFIKPPKSEMGEEVPYDPDCTTGFTSNPWDPELTHLELFLLLNEQMKAEEGSSMAFCRRVVEIETLLRDRKKQIDCPKLSFSLFDPLRNEEARRIRLERFEQTRAREELIRKQQADFLAPYLLRLDLNKCSRNQVMDAYSCCMENLAKFYQKMDDEMKVRLGELNSEELSLKRFLAKFQEHFEEVEYEKFISEGENIELNKNVIQMRIDSLREEYQEKARHLENALHQDPRLAVKPLVEIKLDD
ncbi:coiled-coil domain-containing protein lobo [Uranotaenia lowii]|uniref:coiled-coil domain-containing protein lobo n=1 Tax=Uranotaenia lowii TaxID=190385 RepID=UPI00247858E9|nr:coiled-coil domain-containing protein lobo [Uranotaenia lowii]